MLKPTVPYIKELQECKIKAQGKQNDMCFEYLKKLSRTKNSGKELEILLLNYKEYHERGV